MLATFTVTNLLDGPVVAKGSLPGSLRQAIFDANASGTDDTIAFSMGGTIALTAGSLLVIDDLQFDGPGESKLTIDAQNSSRVFIVRASIDVELSGLTITGGSSNPGGAIFNDGALSINASTISGNSAGDGGAIYNNGTLSITGSTINGNSALFNYSPYPFGGGGGIYNYRGAVAVTNSTISGNTARLDGGGIHNVYGTVTVTNSTISGNSAGDDAGGIYNYGGAVAATNSTISGNVAGDDGGGISNSGYISGTVTVINTVVAGNRLDGGSLDDINAVLGSGSAYNLIGDVGSSGGLITGVDGNLVGVDWKTVLENDGTDPILANNGGPTRTIDLLEGSLAINAGDPSAMAGSWHYATV